MQHDAGGDLGNAWLKTHDAGSGPYMLTSWTPNDSVIYEAYAGYWMGAPKIKHVILKSANDSAAQRLMLEKGDADIARELGADQLAAVAANPDIAITRQLSAGLWYLGLNVKDGPLANVKVRQAIRYLIDYQGMADSFLKGQAIIHQSFVPEGVAGAIEDTPYHLDVAKAKQLLAEAGYPDGFSIKIDSFNYSPFVEISQSIQQSLAEGGIKLEIVQDDHKLIRSIYRARKQEIVTQRWASDYMDPHSNAAWFAYNPDNAEKAKAKTLAWRNSWLDADVNQMTEAARQEKDPQKRVTLYRTIQEKMRDEGPFVLLFQFNRIAATRANVKGFLQGPTYDATFSRLMTK
jgi:peptide/nickel transport system substrate-binding protein